MVCQRLPFEMKSHTNSFPQWHISMITQMPFVSMAKFTLFLVVQDLAIYNGPQGEEKLRILSFRWMLKSSIEQMDKRKQMASSEMRSHRKFFPCYKKMSVCSFFSSTKAGEKDVLEQTYWKEKKTYMKDFDWSFFFEFSLILFSIYTVVPKQKIQVFYFFFKCQNGTDHSKTISIFWTGKFFLIELFSFQQ